MCRFDWLRGVACALMVMVSGQVMAADGADQASKSVRSFWRAGQLYELCISKADNERAHCADFGTEGKDSLAEARNLRFPS